MTFTVVLTRTMLWISFHSGYNHRAILDPIIAILSLAVFSKRLIHDMLRERFLEGCPNITIDVDIITLQLRCLVFPCYMRDVNSLMLLLCCRHTYMLPTCPICLLLLPFPRIRRFPKAPEWGASNHRALLRGDCRPVRIESVRGMTYSSFRWSGSGLLVGTRSK